MADRVIQRNDTAARWQSINPVLATGEIGIEIDGAKGYKIGDGKTRWNDLPYPANPTNVVQELGNNENAVPSQKLVTEKLSELGSEVDNVEFSASNISNLVGYNRLDIVMLNGGYYDKTGLFVEDSSSIYSERIDVSEYNSKSFIIGVKAQNTTGSSRACCAYNKNNNLVNYSLEFKPLKNENGITYYALMAEEVINSLVLSFRKENILLGVGCSSIDSIPDKFNDIDNEIDGIASKMELVTSTVDYREIGTIDVLSGENLVYVKTLDMPKTSNIVVNVTGDKTLLASQAFNIALRDKNGNTISNATGKINEPAIFSVSDYVYSIQIDRFANGVVGSGTLSIEIYNPNYNSVYISANGSDDAQGTLNKPLFSINKALQLGAKEIIMLSGVYEQHIDLSLCKSDSLKIYGEHGGRVVVKPLNYILINDGSEKLVDGTTKVYKKEGVAVGNYIQWIFQEGVSDASTLITEDERHPLQRGKEYRCENTKIQIVTSTNVDDAISEIESSEAFLWFYDSSSNSLYFSRPQQTSVNNAICCGGLDNMLFSGTKENLNLSVCNIEVWYQSINIVRLYNPILKNCSAKYANCSGGFYLSGVIGATLERCEAAMIQRSNNGDGFNGQPYDLTGTDKNGFNTSIKLIDCWSHDNRDDGYSSHERCESIIQGGLFEYNTKGGVTPSYGEENECYNVISRRNIRGFYYTGTADDGGKFGRSICFGCVSMNNTYAGFMCDGVGNRLVAIGCKSINDNAGFRTPNSDSVIELIDCGSVGTSYAKIGNISVNNTNSVD